jgi:hypothetical protein
MRRASTEETTVELGIICRKRDQEDADLHRKEAALGVARRTGDSGAT